MAVHRPVKKGKEHIVKVLVRFVDGNDVVFQTDKYNLKSYKSASLIDIVGTLLEDTNSVFSPEDLSSDVEVYLPVSAITYLKVLADVPAPTE